ncbi:MAG: alkaline phosphatase PhoX, partial [Micromonosporaceae bacterium]
MERRSFLRAAVVGTGSAALGFTLSREALAYPAKPGPSPYGDLQAADARGIRLPRGFTSRIIARSGQTVAGTGYRWHGAPDGGACFADGTGWIYVSNAELGGGAGGVSAVRFNSSAQVTGASRILSGTNRHCAGGPTPWASWLSCEEVDRGYVYETYPKGGTSAVRRAAMGRFKHEAAAADPTRRVIYLTEDESDGCFYRFRSTIWGNLSSGTLQVLCQTSGVLRRELVDEVRGPGGGSQGGGGANPGVGLATTTTPRAAGWAPEFAAELPA